MDSYVNDVDQPEGKPMRTLTTKTASTEKEETMAQILESYNSKSTNRKGR